MSNQFSSSLPSQIGTLEAIMYNLNFNANTFTGQLPTQIGQLPHLLSAFNLNNNAFFSTVPTELGLLNLQGGINFNSASFAGTIPR